MIPNIVLWVYIVLLIAGGLVGFFKAKSEASLIASATFALALYFCLLVWPQFTFLPDILLVLLLIIFGVRLAKTKKFMPSGLMLALTVVALILRQVL